MFLGVSMRSSRIASARVLFRAATLTNASIARRHGKRRRTLLRIVGIKDKKHNSVAPAPRTAV